MGNTVPSEILIDDTLNPKFCNILCALCAPGTESLAIQKDVVDGLSSLNTMENTEISKYILGEGNHTITSTPFVLNRKIRTLHVTYAEPGLQHD